MRDITSHIITRRCSSAVAVIYCDQKCIGHLKSDRELSSILFSIAKSSGFMAAKLTAQIYSNRHLLPIDSFDISFTYISPETHNTFFINYPNYEAGILVRIDGNSLGRAPIDMECLSAATAASMHLYQELYLHDWQMEIGSVKILIEESASSNRAMQFLNVHCAVLSCSNSIASGRRENKSGPIIDKILRANNVNMIDHLVLPCDVECVRQQVQKWVTRGVDFIFTYGGTGLGSQDIIVEALSPLIEKKVDGVTQAMYAHGQLNSSRAMFSRTIAGTIGKSFIVTLPGSSDGLRQSLEAILPALFYAQKMLLATDS